MKNATFLSIVLTLCFFAITAFGENEPVATLPAKENFHLFLLAGQSNMAGRGIVSEEDKTVHPRVFALSKDGKWKLAADPIHYDKSVAGVGLGKSFAITLAEHDKSLSIGLVPAACGGSPISAWKPRQHFHQTNSFPFDDAIKRTKRALKDGVLKGILWHQGESDCRPPLDAAYKLKLETLIKRFRIYLEKPNAPFIIGQLGQFPESPWSESKRVVDQVHKSIAKDMTFVGFASSDGLTCNSDKIHFNTKSLREFGRRYAEVYLGMK